MRESQGTIGLNKMVDLIYLSSIRKNVTVIEIIKINETDESSPCKGYIYKARISRYENSRGDFLETRTMNLLKRKSCTGCEECGGEDDIISDITYAEEDKPDLSHVKHGELYERIIEIEHHTDWESGLPDDDYFLVFKSYKEKNKNE